MQKSEIIHDFCFQDLVSMLKFEIGKFGLGMIKSKQEYAFKNKTVSVYLAC